MSKETDTETEKSNYWTFTTDAARDTHPEFADCLDPFRDIVKLDAGGKKLRSNTGVYNTGAIENVEKWMDVEPKKTGIKDIRDQIVKDIIRDGVMLVSDNKGVVDIAKEAGKGIEDRDNIDIGKVLDTLSQQLTERGLSKSQSNYVLAVSHQGSIAGGGSAALMGLATKYQVMTPICRQGIVSEIKIDNDKNLTIESYQRIALDYNIESGIPTVIHADYNSKDYLVAKVTVFLGKVGDSIDSKQPPVITVEVDGKGKHAKGMIEELKTIKAKAPEEVDVARPNLNKEYEEMLTRAGLEPINEVKKYVRGIIKDYAEKVSPENRKEITYIKGIVPEDQLIAVTTDVLTDNFIQNVENQKVENQKTQNKTPQEKFSKKQTKVFGTKLAAEIKPFVPQNAKTRHITKRFAEDTVNNYLNGQNGNKNPKKGFMTRMSDFLKDKWYGYNIKNYEKKNIRSNAKPEDRDLTTTLKEIKESLSLKKSSGYSSSASGPKPSVSSQKNAR